MTAIPVRWLTVDAPASEVERERSFWTALIGWEGQDGARSVRLGFERSDDAGPVTGRLGFSCDDRRALTGRHAAAGARILAVLPHQTEMADPVGRRYLLS